MTKPNDNSGGVTLVDYLRIIRGSLRHFAIATALTYGDDNVRGTINDYLQIVRLAAQGFEYVAAAGALTADDLADLRAVIQLLEAAADTGEKALQGA